MKGGSKYLSNIVVPKDEESELYVISSLLQKPEKIEEIKKILQPEDFFNREYMIIFASLLDIDLNNGADGILVKLKEELLQKNQFNRIGGAKRLISIQDACIVPSNLIVYAEKVKKKAVDRILLKKTYSFVEGIKKGEDKDTLKSLCIDITSSFDDNSEAEYETEKTPSLDFPEIMSGLAGDFARVYGDHLESPYHFFYFSFVTCLGALLSHRISLKSLAMSQPRFFTLILGESADDRKSTAIDKTIKFFSDNLYVAFNTCWGIGSAEGLIRKLEKLQKNQDQKELQLLLCFDEFKSFVSKANIETSVLLTCVNSLFESNHYESGTKSHDITLKNVYLSILAASTIETYQKIWNTAYTDIGFDNRIWLVPGASDKTFAVPEHISKIDTERLLSKLRHVLQFTTYGYVYEMSKKAYQLYAYWYKNREKTIYSKRLDGYALRLMPLLAVNDIKIEIDEDIVKKAIALVEWQLEVRKELSPIDADNTIAKIEESIRRQLRKGPLKERELKQRTNSNRTGLFYFNTALKNLTNAKEIKYDKYSKKYKLSNEYCN